MPNIKFHYLYRDSGNYKNFGYVVIDNPENLSLEEFDAAIKSRLIDGEYFYANEWNLPDLRFSNLDIDPTWHEFAKIEFTEEALSKLALAVNMKFRKLSSTSGLRVLSPNPVKNWICLLSL